MVQKKTVADEIGQFSLIKERIDLTYMLIMCLMNENNTVS